MRLAVFLREIFLVPRPPFVRGVFQEAEKFHVRKVKCLVRVTERKMSVWRVETSDDL